LECFLKLWSELPLPSTKSNIHRHPGAAAFSWKIWTAQLSQPHCRRWGAPFHVNPVDLNIGMTAYLLMLAVFIPISGWFADRFSARAPVFCLRDRGLYVVFDPLRTQQPGYAVSPLPPSSKGIGGQ